MFSKIIITLLVLTSLYGFTPQRIEADDVYIPAPKTIDDYINSIFGDKAKIAKAVLKAESGLKLNAKGYNCYYGGKSKACKPVDRPKAHSVDCGILQINVKGQTCPDYLLTLDGNMQVAEQIYKTQGLRAWSAFNNKSYLKFLD